MVDIGRITLILALCFALIGCDGSGPPTPGGGATIDERIGAGNASYAAGDHAAALEQYHAAVAHDSTSAAAWYGVHMAAAALGDSAQASAALARVQLLAPDAGLSEHPRTLPAGHPPTGGGARPPPVAY